MSKTIGQRIRELREQKGLTQQELANYLGCAQTTIAEWENRRDRLPGGKLLRDVAKVFGVSVDYLLSSETSENSEIPCYGEVSSEEFIWPNTDDPQYFIEVPPSEYKSDRFSLKILHSLLEPVACKNDYCIFEKLKPEDSDIVIVRFPDKGDRTSIKMWRQQDMSVVLSGINIGNPQTPYFFEVTHPPDDNLCYSIMAKQSPQQIIIEGRLVAVRRVLKSVTAYPRINYIFS